VGVDDLNMAGTDVCVVVVHYGSVDITSRCIKSLARLKPHLRLYVVNNGSIAEAESLERVIARYPDLAAEVLHQDSNRGFAAGCNAGIRRALESGATHLWLLNNDAEAAADSLLHLLSFSRENPAAVIGSTVVEADRPGIIQCAGGVAYSPATTIIHTAHTGQSSRKAASLPEPKIDYIYGASLFVSADLFQELGFLDERYFLYYEELDICRRALAKGYVLKWCRGSVVRHHGGQATGTRTGDTARLSGTAAFHESRSLVLFTCRHHPVWLPAVLVMRLFARTALLFVRGQSAQAGAALRGIFSGCSECLSRLIKGRESGVS